MPTVLEVLLVWGLSGPEVAAVLRSRELCEALADRRPEPVALCAPMQVDNALADVLYCPLDAEETVPEWVRRCTYNTLGDE